MENNIEVWISQVRMTQTQASQGKEAARHNSRHKGRSQLGSSKARKKAGLVSEEQVVQWPNSQQELDYRP